MAKENGDGHAKDQVLFSLSRDKRDQLEAIVAKGKHKSQKVLNALILLNYDDDAPDPITLGEKDIAAMFEPL